MAELFLISCIVNTMGVKQQKEHKTFFEYIYECSDIMLMARITAYGSIHGNAIAGAAMSYHAQRVMHCMFATVLDNEVKVAKYLNTIINGTAKADNFSEFIMFTFLQSSLDVRIAIEDAMTKINNEENKDRNKNPNTPSQLINKGITSLELSATQIEALDVLKIVKSEDLLQFKNNYQIEAAQILRSTSLNKILKFNNKYKLDALKLLGTEHMDAAIKFDNSIQITAVEVLKSYRAMHSDLFQHIYKFKQDAQTDTLKIMLDTRCSLKLQGSLKLQECKTNKIPITDTLTETEYIDCKGIEVIDTLKDALKFTYPSQFETLKYFKFELSKLDHALEFVKNSQFEALKILGEANKETALKFLHDGQILIFRWLVNESDKKNVIKHEDAVRKALKFIANPLDCDEDGCFPPHFMIFERPGVLDVSWKFQEQFQFIKMDRISLLRPKEVEFCALIDPLDSSLEKFFECVCETAEISYLENFIGNYSW